MQTKAENLLNPYRHHLSAEAKKRLRWLYILYEESKNNVSRAADKIGISRQWLSVIKNTFERNNRDPRSLEPDSRAPHDHAGGRRRIAKEVEDKIIEIRDKYGWGERKISKVLQRDYGLRSSPPTVNRYLHKHGKIDPKLSQQIKDAWLTKTEREKQKEINLKIKYRPPAKIKDYRPGALIEKDVKLVPKTNGFNSISGYKMKDYFYYQHSFLDSFTRIRCLELAQESNSQESKLAYQKIKVKERMPFEIACFNTDNGSENGKDFSDRLQEDDIIHFWSKTATPTDNPRIERSHLTDDKEFYGRGNIYKTFEEQRTALKNWEYIGNYIRPHQALGYLTPMEFYRLWKKNPKEAYRITEEYQSYLKKQRIRLANSRRLKKREQIEKLMQFIDAKLSKKVELLPYKLELIKCQLCQ